MDIPQTPGKRKRETNAPRITYHAASRTFDRLFKEESLDETKDVVRRKLGLPESSSIYLAQIRGEHTVDLEDEDDFDAFYAIAHSNMAVEVQVTTEENSPTYHTGPSPAPVGTNTKVVPTPTDAPSASSETPAGNESRRSHKVTFRVPSPDSANLPPNNQQHHALASSNSTVPENSQPNLVRVPSTHSTTNHTENQITPAKEKKGKKADQFVHESLEVENSARSGTTEHTDKTEATPKTKSKKKPQKASESQRTSSALTSKKSDEIITIAPSTSRSAKKSKRRNSETVSNNFSQQLAQTITDGHLASAEVEDESAPPPKRIKRGNSVAGDVAGHSVKTKASEWQADGKAKVAKPVLDRASETINGEQPDGKLKPKRNNKGEWVSTSAEIAAIRGDIGQLIASVTTGEPAVAPKPKQSRLAAQPTITTEILAADRSTDRINSLPTLNKPSVPTKSILASSSESSDNDDDDRDDFAAISKPIPVFQPDPAPNTLDDIDSGMYLEDLLRGPIKRRLTLDNVLLPLSTVSSRKRKAVVLEEDSVVTPKSVRRLLQANASAWLNSDTDDAGYDSASDSAETVASSLPSNVQPPLLEISKNLVAPSVAAALPIPLDTVTDDTALPGQVGSVDIAANGTITEPSSEVHRSMTPMNEQHVVFSDPGMSERPSLSHDSPEHDSIEPILPSPRSHSPIENALATTDTVQDVRRSTLKTHSKPGVVFPRRPTRKSISQPISKHEADVRQSVVKLTKTRSKPVIQTQTPPTPVPLPSPTPLPSPRRLRSATQPVRTTSTVNQTPNSLKKNHARTLGNTWTILHAGPSSAADAESPSRVDELHSSSDRERASPTIQLDPEAEAPLFIASESQVNFPYSQFQEIDGGTVNGDGEVPTSVRRLEEDSEEEDEVQETITPRVIRRGSTAYRGLSQIANQSKFFTGFQPTFVATSTPKNSKEDMYGPLSQAYDDDDASDSGSESETEGSHIPRARRAGIKR